MCDYRTVVGDEFEWSDVGERVHEARLAAGLSQADLAGRIGLDRTMVAKIEAGSRRLDALELVRLAAALALPLEHFLRRPPAVVSRRATAVAEDTITEATNSSYRLDAALEGWLHEVRQLVAPGFVRLPALLCCPFEVTDETAAREAARWLRDRLDLGSRPIPTMMEVAERAGQFVLVTDLPGDGASLVDGGLAVAVVSRTGEPGRRRATGAHELGHLIVGDEYSSDLGVSASRQEREDVIDAFAAELLLPSQAITESRDGGGSVDRARLVELAALYRTSWTLALKQARHAGVIGRDDFRKLSADRPTRAEFMEAVGWEPMPDLESVRVPPTYARGVMEAWRDNHITSVRAVELMHGQIERDDLPNRAAGDDRR